MPLRRANMTGVRPILLAALVLLVLSFLLPARAAGTAGKDYIVKYKDSAAALMGDDSPAPFDVVSEAEMRRLDRAGLLAWYEEDGEAFLLDEEPAGELPESLSPFYDDRQWNQDMIGAEAAFRHGYLGQGVRVGVIDSGVNPHPDFGDRLLEGHNYMEDAADPEETADRYGHGTRVAGLVAASGGSGHIGPAPGARLVPLKVTDEKSIRISAICRAIYGGVDDYHCDVLNLSLGVTRQYESLKEAIAYCEQEGVVVVSAVGNNGNRTFQYPAGYDTVIGMGAVDSDGRLYYHSNCNESVFLTAPGEEVRTTYALGGYTTASGTSFAVPQAAGAAAVLMSADRTLTPQAIRDLMRETAIDAGAEGYDECYGCGILNLGGCVEALTGGAEVPAESPCTFLPASGPAGALRNNTDEAAVCTYILAWYDSAGVCRIAETRQLSIPPEGTVSISPPDGTRSFGQFVCRTDTLIPLAPARKAP